MGPAARAHLRQDVPALVRGLPGAGLAAAGRGVQAALRAPVDDGAHAVRARAGAAPRSAAAAARCSARGSRSCLVLVLVLGALYALGSWGDDGSGGGENTAETPTATPAKKAKKRKKPAAPTRVTLQIVPTGIVNVCLVDAAGKTLINNQDLQAGNNSKRYRGKRFRVSFGNGQVRLKAGKRTIDVPGPLDPDRLRRAARQAPARAVRVAPADAAREGRASSSPAPRCCRGSSPTATGRGCRSACASTGSRWPRS